VSVFILLYICVSSLRAKLSEINIMMMMMMTMIYNTDIFVDSRDRYWS